jgi:murein DD-endopeptidase MepM/ murein hydrolase activator NlpD
MRAVLSLTLALAALLSSALDAQVSRRTATVRGTPAQPGSVLEITLHGAQGDHDPDGVSFGRPLVFEPGNSPFTWRTLVGIDVAQAPGPATFRIDVATPAGRELAATGTITVAPRAFATRRLRVASRFVDPSAGDVERIQTEAARLEDIFTTVTLPGQFAAFAAPIAGLPGSNFGTRSIFNGEPRAPHAGVDFRGATGTPIAAPGNGRVVLAEDLFFTGQTVVIDHGLGLYSLLAHLSRLDTQAGQTVRRGETVGLLGATGRVTGPHLHWTVRLNGARVDPLRAVALLAAAHPGAGRRARMLDGAGAAPAPAPSR